MIILLYLCVILGWALLILVIKCRKAREKRILLQQQQEAQAQAAVHVIQIGNSFYDVIPITNSGSRCSLDHPHTCRRFLQSNSTNSLSHTNPSFIMDESVFPNGNMVPPIEPPPSYEEVIRAMPNMYPKTNSSLHPIQTISELEANAPSITTLTSDSPAIISNTNRHNNAHHNNNATEIVA